MEHDVKVLDVAAYPDGRLIVTGTVNGQKAVGSGWTSWLEKYWDEDSKLVPYKKGSELLVRKKRKATQDEARAYAEQLLLEAAGLWGVTDPPVKIKLDQPDAEA